MQNLNDVNRAAQKSRDEFSHETHDLQNITNEYAKIKSDITRLEQEIGSLRKEIEQKTAELNRDKINAPKLQHEIEAKKRGLVHLHNEMENFVRQQNEFLRQQNAKGVKPLR